MNDTRWIFIVLFILAVAYEIFALVQNQGNSISECVWSLQRAQPFWRYVIALLFLHFILGESMYDKFMSLFK